jgi:hypothetical protein
MLILSLYGVAEDMAKAYDSDRTGSELEDAAYRICRRIYDSSSRTKGKSETFDKWETAFKHYKINSEK